MLFTFPSRYLFTVGHQRVFSLTPWSALIHAKFHVCRITQEFPRLDPSFRLRACHPLWRNFPEASPNSIHATSGSYNPGGKAPGLGWSAFVRHYLRNRIRFLLLRVLRCFTSPGMASQPLCIEGCTQRYEPLQVIPFGNPRVKASLPLSEAYRSLARPSSPAGAKAFTMCSNLLDACSSRLLAEPASNLCLFSLFLLWSPTKGVLLLICLVQFSKNLAPSQHLITHSTGQMVGLNGLEPLTPALSRRCSNQLSYRPGV